MEKKNVGTEGKSFKNDLTIAKDLTIELPERPESKYYQRWAKSLLLVILKIKIKSLPIW